MPAEPITIRRAVPADGFDLRLLALLDSAHELRGAVLVAESGGELRAAWSIDEARAIADPFASTTEHVDLLRLRAGQVVSRRRKHPRPPRARAWRRAGVRALAPGRPS